MVDTSLFYQDVYSVVKEIPAGRVATYKQIAVLTGFPQHARLVGRALRNVPDALGLPCHRVVNGCGRLFRPGRNRKHCWKPKVWLSEETETWICGVMLGIRMERHP